MLILVTSKYGKAATCSCIPRVPRHSPRVNRGFNPIQQQPSHHSRCVPFLWTEKHLDIPSGRLGASVSNHLFAVLSIEAIHGLLRVPLVLNVSCFLIKTPYMKTTIFTCIIHLQFRCLYCAHAKLHAPFPSDGLHLQGVEVIGYNAFLQSKFWHQLRMQLRFHFP